MQGSFEFGFMYLHTTRGEPSRPSAAGGSFEENKQ